MKDYRYYITLLNNSNPNLPINTVSSKSASSDQLFVENKQRKVIWKNGVAARST